MQKSPSTAVFPVRHLTSGNQSWGLQDGNTQLEWNSRAHRKRRNPVVSGKDGVPTPRRTHWRLWGMDTGNLSWWVPFLFICGSGVWLLNGSLALHSVSDPKLQAWLTSASALLGGFIFILGAYAAYFEVINRPEYVHAREHDTGIRAYPSHHHAHLQHQPSAGTAAAIELCHWGWWLNVLQLIGALVFFIACASGMLLPLDIKMDRMGWYWLPQMVGACFFFFSSLMAMREVQNRWWQPAWNKIGWHVAFFNAVGAVGFFLCAWFGVYADTPESLFWGSDVSTFWGSLAFLISSYLMMLEVLNP